MSPVPSLSIGSHPIRVWSGMHIELLWVYDGPVHPTNRHRQTDHTQGHWVWLILAGSVEVRQGRSVLSAAAGECMVSPHGKMRQNFSDDARILSIHFNCEWPTGDNLFVERKGCVFKTADYPLFATKARRLVDFVKAGFRAEPDVHFAQQPVIFDGFLRLQRHFIEWLKVFSNTMLEQGYTFTEIGKIDDRLLHVVRCLKETPLEDGYPEQLIQSESGLGRSQIDRRFLQTFGLSTRSYWNNRKLDSAKALLTTTACPVKELGFRLGFKQASHFTKWFTAEAGITPLAYRKRESLDS